MTTPPSTAASVSQPSPDGWRPPADGPVRARCEVLATGRLGPYTSLTLVAPEIAARARPGQFVSLAVEAPDTLLRRPFSLYRAQVPGRGAGTIEVVFDAIGPGTRWLAARAKRDEIDVVGPLGRPFPLPQRRVSCVLVGGGYGAAPLLYLAESLRALDLPVHMVLGAAEEERIFNALEAKRLCSSVTITTDDGSQGLRGRVTDALPEVLARTDAGVIYACGPMPMLAAVSRLAVAHGLPCQVAVEEAMACGVGVCFTCVVPVRRDAEVANLRACLEGPVFNGARIDWDQLFPPAAAATGAGVDAELAP